MRAELHSNAQRDHQVDKGDSIQADTPQWHHTHDRDNRQSNNSGDNQPCFPRAEHDGCDDKYGGEAEAQHFLRDGNDMGVLVEEDVEQGVREHGSPRILRDLLRDPVSSLKGIDKVVLRLQRLMECPEVRGDNVRPCFIDAERRAE